MDLIYRKIHISILFFLIISILQSCGIYSFSGINLGNAKTITFSYFDNVAPIVYPELSQKFYDEMYSRFVNQTPLEYVNKDGDLTIEGKIIGYDVKPINIQAGEVAANNRLTVTVKIKYTNFTNPKDNFEKTFSWYADFPSNKNLSDVEDELTNDIVKKIVDDIFNATVVNW